MKSTRKYLHEISTICKEEKIHTEILLGLANYQDDKINTQSTIV